MPERTAPIERPSSPSDGEAGATHAPVRPRRHRCRRVLTLLLAVTLASTASPTPADDSASEERHATATSDLLIVLGDDGRPRLVQHTLTSDGALLSLALPDGVVPEQVSFAGPERAVFADALRRSPGRVALWSGSALLRHDSTAPAATDPPRGGSGGSEPTDAARAEKAGTDGEAVTSRGTFTLAAPSIPDGLVVEDGALARSRIVWLFPEALESVSFTSVADGLGRWRRAGSTLVFDQRGGGSTPLGITWRRRAAAGSTCDAMRPVGVGCAPASDSAEAPGTTATATMDAAADRGVDRDADGVPDHRDVCLATGDGPATGRGVVDPLGCIARTPDARPVQRLDGIAFPAGQSYLDGPARAVLDRLADALVHSPEGTWEIAAHTDGAGSRARNLRLSETRAQAVRHYLMLRGLGPNRLRARGYGEARPIGDDRTEAGRRANRRIEVRRVD